MNCQFPTWREQGDWFGRVIRLRSRIFFRRFLRGEGRLLNAGLVIPPAKAYDRPAIGPFGVSARGFWPHAPHVPSPVANTRQQAVGAKIGRASCRERAQKLAPA